MGGCRRSMALLRSSMKTHINYSSSFSSNFRINTWDKLLHCFHVSPLLDIPWSIISNRISIFPIFLFIFFNMEELCIAPTTVVGFRRKSVLWLSYKIRWKRFQKWKQNGTMPSVTLKMAFESFESVIKRWSRLTFEQMKFLYCCYVSHDCLDHVFYSLFTTFILEMHLAENW